MTALSKSLLGVAAVAALLATSGVSASAAIACVGRVCWHSHESYTYPRHSRVIVHEDSWRWRPHERYSWREHEGRGYWRGSRWTEF